MARPILSSWTSVSLNRESGLASSIPATSPSRPVLLLWYSGVSALRSTLRGTLRAVALGTALAVAAVGSDHRGKP